MLWNATKIMGFEVDTADGMFGKVADLLFTPETWIVRSVAIDAGGARVAVPVAEIGKLDAPSSRLLLKPSAQAALADAAAQTGLRSLADMLSYEINATDGGIGHAQDFVVRETDWQITFIAVDAQTLEPDAKVMISRHAVTRVDWERRLIALDVDTKAVRASPPYEAQSAVDGDDKDEDKVLTYFGIKFVNTKHE